MNIASASHPSFEIYLSLEKNLLSMRSLLAQLEKDDRREYINSLIVRLLETENKRSSVAAAKTVQRKSENPTSLSADQKRKIAGLTRRTEELYRVMKENNDL